MEEKTVFLPNIQCEHCVRTLRLELEEIEGMTTVDADPATKRATIRWQAPASWTEIEALLEEIGYPPAA